MRDLHTLNRYRQGQAEIALYGSVGDDRNGIFVVPVVATKFKVIASADDAWEHVSVSPLFKKRCPTWTEMATIKDLFFKHDEVVMELHVAAQDHISLHDYCLHLWKPLQAEIPLPESWRVG